MTIITGFITGRTKITPVYVHQSRFNEVEIQFHSPKDSHDAKLELDQHQFRFHSQWVNCKWSVQFRENKGPLVDGTNHSHWIQLLDLQPGTTRKQIKKYIESKAGITVNVKGIYLSKNDSFPERWNSACVECANHEEAEQLKVSLNNKWWNGSRLLVQITDDFMQKGKSGILEISNLKKGLKVESLWTFIRNVCKPRMRPKISIKFDHHRRTLVATLTFKDKVEAKEIGETLNGIVMDGRQLVIQWPWANRSMNAPRPEKEKEAVSEKAQGQWNTKSIELDRSNLQKLRKTKKVKMKEQYVRAAERREDGTIRRSGRKMRRDKRRLGLLKHNRLQMSRQHKGRVEQMSKFIRNP